MPIISTAASNAAVNAVLGLCAYVACHTASPGSTGASEYAGVTRQACSWNTASGGSGTNSSSLAFTTSGATPVTHLGGWSAVTAGAFEVGFPLGASVTATNISVAPGAISLAGT